MFLKQQQIPLTPKDRVENHIVKSNVQNTEL